MDGHSLSYVYKVTPAFLEYLEAFRPGVAQVLRAQPQAAYAMGTAFFDALCQPRRHRLVFPGLVVDAVTAVGFDRLFKRGDEAALILDDHPEILVKAGVRSPQSGWSSRWTPPNLKVGDHLLVPAGLLLKEAGLSTRLPVTITRREGFIWTVALSAERAFPLDVDEALCGGVLARG